MSFFVIATFLLQQFLGGTLIKTKPFLNNLFDKLLTKTKSLHKIETVLSDLTHIQ